MFINHYRKFQQSHIPVNTALFALMLTRRLPMRRHTYSCCLLSAATQTPRGCCGPRGCGYGRGLQACDLAGYEMEICAPAQSTPMAELCIIPSYIHRLSHKSVKRNTASRYLLGRVFKAVCFVISVQFAELPLFI